MGQPKRCHGTEGKVLATVLKSMADFNIFICLDWCHSYGTNYTQSPVPAERAALHGTHGRVMGAGRGGARNPSRTGLPCSTEAETHLMLVNPFILGMPASGLTKATKSQCLQNKGKYSTSSLIL